MTQTLLSCTDPVTLVGAGPSRLKDLQTALSFAPACVAADGGAARALAAGADLRAVIGDFDSISEQTLADIPKAILHPVEEQLTTDFEKCLARIRTPLVIAVGFLGGRIDHQLAAFHALMAFAHRPCVLMGEDEIVFLAPPRMSLATQAGDLVSLFPMNEMAGTSEGLEWPLDGLRFQPGAQIGTSNRALGPVQISVSAPSMLVILKRPFLSDVVTRLSAPKTARWPAPGL